jgi:hypothetical protein
MSDWRALTIIVLLCLCLSIVSASPQITDYNVPSQVNLGDMITATGIYSDTNGSTYNKVLCSFYFLDANGDLVKRASDQYTTGTGRFTMVNFIPSEPIFKRGETYTLQSECESSSASDSFLLAQRESIAHVGSNEFEYITNPENTDTLFIWGAIIGILLLVFMFLFGIIRIGGRR